jgi:hypothetical protein
MSAATPKYKIASEVAEQEFERMCEAFRVELDTSELTEDERKEWQDLRAEVVRDLRIGSLIVGVDGRPTYTPPGASKGFTFNAATGATLIALRSKTNEVEGNCMAMADMTQTDRGTFSKLAARDFFACGRIVRLFLVDR